MERGAREATVVQEVVKVISRLLAVDEDDGTGWRQIEKHGAKSLTLLTLLGVDDLEGSVRRE